MADKIFTRAEVKASDLKKTNVFIIDDEVYDVQSFLEEHPGGHEVLQAVAGQDATESFNDIGHSLDAKALMIKYKVGTITQEERKPKPTKRGGGQGHSSDQESSEGFSWTTPLVLGVLATIFYYYLFG